MRAQEVRTIADIARIAGVSKSTVSRALSGSPLVSEATRDRIRAIARQHNFQVSAPARRLSLQRSNTIGFVTHAYHKDFTWADLFGLEILGGISRGLHEVGYDVLIIHVDPADTKWARRYIDTGRVDGFILQTSCRKQDHVKALLSIDAPFIIWGFPQPGQRFCSVIGDDVAGGRLAVEHLIAQGRKKIAFLGGYEVEPEVQYRLRGYKEGLEAAGMDVASNLIAFGDYSDVSGAEVMLRLLDIAPDLDAVFINSDVMAIAAMDAIRKTGRVVPDDVAVIGYDDLSIAATSHPPLTTVRQNVPEAGRLLARNLIEFLDTGLVTNVTVPVELVVRESA